MDLIHRLMILVAVLCCHCHCQNIERDQAILILKNLYDRQSDILQTLQDMKMQMNSTKQELEMEMNTTREEMIMEMNTTREEMKMEMNTTREEVQSGLTEVQSGLTEVQSGLTEVQNGLGLIQELHDGQNLIQGSQREQNDKIGGVEDRMGRIENALESSQQETVSSFKSVLTAKLLESRQHLGNDWTSNQLPEIKAAITGSTSEIKNTVSGVTNGVNGIKDTINSLQSTLRSSQNSAATNIKNKMTEATKKIKGLMVRLHALGDSNIHNIGKRWYFFSPSQMDWNGAEGFCQQHGGHLAQITTDEQFEFLKDKSGDVNHWIGLSDTYSEGTYKWTVDGSSHAPSRKPDWWGEDEPNDAGGIEDCIEYSHNWKKLNDVKCSGIKRFVCEFDGTAFY